jgi:hypothetical protein
MQAEKEVVQIVSSSPGRLRLKFPLENTQVPDLDRFLLIPAVTEVRYRKLTGSLVILYESTRCDLNELVWQISQCHSSLAIVSIPRDPAERALPQNLLSSSMYRSSEAINRAVYRKTSGVLALTSIVPVAFFTWAVVSAIRYPSLPQWFELYREGSFLWHFYQGSREE